MRSDSYRKGCQWLAVGGWTAAAFAAIGWFRYVLFPIDRGHGPMDQQTLWPLVQSFVLWVLPLVVLSLACHGIVAFCDLTSCPNLWAMKRMSRWRASVEPASGSVSHHAYPSSAPRPHRFGALRDVVAACKDRDEDSLTPPT